MKAIIKVDVPEFQIGQEATVYFRDTMCTKGVCEKEEERKAGEWLKTKSKDWYICSECGLCVRSCLPVHHLHYCHNCGAKMKCTLDCSCCSKQDCKERRST